MYDRMREDWTKYPAVNWIMDNLIHIESSDRVAVREIFIIMYENGLLWKLPHARRKELYNAALRRHHQNQAFARKEEG